MRIQATEGFFIHYIRLPDPKDVGERHADFVESFLIIIVEEVRRVQAL